METETVPMAEKQGSRTPMVAIGLVIVALLAGGGYLAWNYFRTTSQATADAMPADTLLYVSTDFLGVLTSGDDGAERLQYALQPYLEAFESEEEQTLAELVDTEVLSVLGLTIEEDITTWIGRSMGFGIFDTVDEAGDDLPVAVLVMEIRPTANDAADQMIAKLVANYPDLPDADGNSLSERTYQGVTYYVEEGESIEDGINIGRSDNLMLFAVGEAGMKRAIDSQQGRADSLTSNRSYQNVIDGLPSNRIITMYLDVARVVDGVEPIPQEDLVQEFQNQMNGASLPQSEDASDLYEFARRVLATEEQLSGFGTAVFFDEIGLRMQMVNVYSADSDVHALPMLRNSLPSGEIAEQLPQDTLFYVTSKGVISEAWRIYAEQDPEAFAEAMQLAESTVGVNPDTVLMSRLGDEMALAVYQSQEGFLAVDGLDIGIALLHEINAQPGELTETLFEPLNGAIEEMLFVPINANVTDTYEFYSLMDDFSAEEPISMMSYGINNGYLMFGTGVSEMTTMFGSGAKLIDNSHVQSLQNVMSERDGHIQMFIDFDTICTLDDASEEEFCLYGERFNAFAMTGTAQDHALVTDLYLFLDDVPAAENETE